MIIVTLCRRKIYIVNFYVKPYVGEVYSVYEKNSAENYIFQTENQKIFLHNTENQRFTNQN